MMNWHFDSPLAEAVRERDRRKLRALIAEMPAEDFQKQARGALLEACQRSLAGMARILLDAGANPNEGKGCMTTPGWVVRLFDFPLVVAADKTPELVSTLLSYGANPNQAEGFGNTPLMEAAAFGKPCTMARLLLDAGAEINAVDMHGYSALHKTALWGSCTSMELLLNYGAIINLQTKDGYTPLMLAAMWGNGAQVGYLLQHGANLFLRNQNGDSAFGLAVQRGWPHSVRVLLEEGASAHEKDNLGRSLLFHALRRRPYRRNLIRRAQVVRLLLKHGANATEPIRHGITALHLAAWHGWTDVLAVMLEYVRLSAPKDHKSRTPLDYATRRGHQEAAQLLKNHEERR